MRLLFLQSLSNWQKHSAIYWFWYICLNPAQVVKFNVAKYAFNDIQEHNILTHKIRIPEVLSWDRKSYLTYDILPRMLSKGMWNCILALLDFWKPSL